VRIRILREGSKNRRGRRRVVGGGGSLYNSRGRCRVQE